MKRPDFIGIGAMKAATTWAWHQLDDHPEVRMPKVKELHYFDRLEILPEQYLSRFNRFPSQYKTGEVTPAYLTIPHAPPLVKSFCPKVKLFVILRNPVDRAFSHWKVALWTENKIPPGTSVLEAFNFGHPWPGPFWHSLKEKGNYVRYLKRWYTWFKEDQLKVFWHDDVANNPEQLVKDLYEWVGVDPHFNPPNLKKKYNENWSGRDPVFNPEDRQKILDYYLPSIEKLEEFTGRDLSAWKV